MVNMTLVLLLMSTTTLVAALSSSMAHRETGGVVDSTAPQCRQSSSLFGRYYGEEIYGVTVCMIRATRLEISCVDVNYFTYLYDAQPIKTTMFPQEILVAEHAFRASSAHTCAILTDGTAYCVGSNAKGQLGVGDVLDRSAPSQVLLASEDVPTSLSLLADTSCILTVAGKIMCWGEWVGATSPTTYYEQTPAATAAEICSPCTTFDSYSGYCTVVSPSVCMILADGTVRCMSWDAEPEVLYEALPLGQKAVLLKCGLYLEVVLEDGRLARVFHFLSDSVVTELEITTPGNLAVIGLDVSASIIGENMCVLLADLSLACSAYQLSTVDTDMRNTLVQVDLGGKKALAMKSVGGGKFIGVSGYVITLLEDGSMDYRVGYDSGTLGTDEASPFLSEELVPLLASICPAIVTLSSGDDLGAALLAAVDAVSYAATSIMLGAGVYTIASSYMEIFSTVALLGAGSSSTFVTCTDTGTSCLTFSTASRVTLSGFTLQLPSARERDLQAVTTGGSGGITLTYVETAEISDVIIDGARGDNGAALSISCGSGVSCRSIIIEDSTFSNNVATEYGGAVYLDISFEGTLFSFSNVVFNRNTAVIAGGAFFFKRAAWDRLNCEQSGISFTGCVFEGNVGILWGDDHASDTCSIGWRAEVASIQESGKPFVDTTGAAPTLFALDAYGANVLTEDNKIVLINQYGGIPATSLSAFSSSSSYTYASGSVTLNNLILRAQPASAFLYNIVTSLDGSFETTLSSLPVTVNTAPCSMGTYRELTASDDTLYTCVTCLPGMYSNAYERVSCTTCAALTYCPGGSDTETPCPATYTSTAGSAACVCDNSLYPLSIAGVQGCTDDLVNNSTSNCPTVGGTLLTVAGSNFGTSFASITLGGTPCIATLYNMTYTSTQNNATKSNATDICISPVGWVQCVLPSGTGLNQLISVRDTTGSAEGRLVSYALPTVDTVSGCMDDGSGGTANCPRAGDNVSITVTGANFGPNMATVLIGGVIADSGELPLGASTDNVAVCMLPPGSGVSQTINILQKNGEVSLARQKILSYTTCGSGMYNVPGADGFVCSPCPLGYFNSEDESYACSPCQKGYYCNATTIQNCGAEIPGATSAPLSFQLSNCTCPISQLLIDTPDSGLGYCDTCPEGVACDVEGRTLSGVTVLPGFWRTSIYSTDVRPCVDPQACIGGVGAGSDLCEEGRKGPFPYCAVCENRYSMSFGGTCKRCETGTTSVPMIIAGSCAILISTLFLANRKGPSTENVESAEDITLGPRRGSLEVAGDRASSSLASNGSAGASQLSAVFKSLVSFTQIIGSMPSVFLLKFPPGFTKLLGIMSFINLSFMKVFSVDCVATSVNFHSEVLFKTISPVIVTVLIVCITLVKRSEIKWQGCMSSFLVLTYLVLPLHRSALAIFSQGVSTTVFRTFPCESFDDGTSWLRADYSIDCDSSEHKMVVIYAYFMILVYPVGIPSLYFWLLWRNRKFLDPLDAKGLPPTEALEIRNNATQHLKGLSFLYQNYKPRAYWYELIETTRRLALTGLIIFFMAGSASQLALAIVVMMVSLILVEKHDPYIRHEDGRLNFVAQFQTFLALVAGLLIQTKGSVSDGYSNGAFSGVLISLVLSVFVFAAYTIMNTASEKGKVVYEITKQRLSSTPLLRPSIFSSSRKASNEQDENVSTPPASPMTQRGVRVSMFFKSPRASKGQAEIRETERLDATKPDI